MNITTNLTHFGLNSIQFEDIDSKFGKIWVRLRCQDVACPQDYKVFLEEVFQSSNIKCVVKDIFVTPDYVAWLDPIIDPSFQRWTKEIYTQLQWKFIAVEPSEFFPLGVKTM
jgi:hypothetical protein